MKHLVLLGAGLTHLALCRFLQSKSAMPGRITVLNDSSSAVYASMVPGVIAGQYARDECEIDLPGLCRRAGVEFVQAHAAAIDLPQQCILFTDLPPLKFDLLSINCGGTSASIYASRKDTAPLPVKPLPFFLAQWSAFYEKRLGGGELRPTTIVIVGGGATGFEISCAIRSRLRKETRQVVRLLLVDRNEALITDVRLPGYLSNFALSMLVRRACKRKNIELKLGCTITDIGSNHLVLDGGENIEADLIISAAGIQAPDWIRESGLAATNEGFVRITPTLQCEGHPNIFACGDVAHLEASQYPKNAWYALRQVPILYHNIVAAMSNQQMRSFVPNRHCVLLLNSGEGKSIAAYGSLAWESRLIWLLKDAIDKYSMKSFNTDIS